MLISEPRSQEVEKVLNIFRKAFITQSVAERSDYVGGHVDMVISMEIVILTVIEYNIYDMTYLIVF